MIDKDDLRAARQAYDMAIENADQARAAIVAQAIDEGMAQKDVIEAMGYSRETVRRIAMLGNWYAGKRGAKPPGRPDAPGMNIYGLKRTEQEPTP